MQDLRARLAEAEEMARTAERQKNQLQRLLQEFRRRLTTLQLDTQRMLEKVSLLESRPLRGEVGQHSRLSFTGICLHLLVSYGIHQSAACDREPPRRKWLVVLGWDLGSQPFLLQVLILVCLFQTG